MGHLSVMRLVRADPMLGNGRSGKRMGTTPPRRYVSSSEGRELKGATNMTPANAVGLLICCWLLRSGEDSSWLFGIKSFDGLINFSATALETAVPRLWPRMTMFSGGILAVCRTQLTRAVPSAIRPASVGEPVECPKPR